MTAVVAITDATHATVSLTGTALAHQAINSTSIQIVFLASLFTSGFTAVGSTPMTLSVSFLDQPTLSFNTSAFNEVTANNGTTTSSAVATLTGDTFTTSVADGNVLTPTTHYTVANVPAGMTVVVTKNSATSATVTLTGAVTGNLTNPADVTNLTISFTNAAFTNTTASFVTGSTKSDFVVNFTDTPVITYDVATFTESAALNGSIGTTVNFTLTGDTFAVVGLQTTQVSVGNVPSGLSAVVTTTSSTGGTITLTGTAATHTNAADIGNLSVTWLNGAFTDTSAASNVILYTKTNFVVDYGDAAIVYSGSGFTETSTNAGLVSGSIIATLTGATFTNAGSTLTPGVDVTL
jgi:hypothetical protein